MMRRFSVPRMPSADLPKTGSLNGRIGAGSRSVWTTWVGTWQFREKIAYGLVVILLGIIVVQAIALVRDAGKPTIPPAVIMVDRYGQVLGVQRPTLSPIGDAPLKHFLLQFVSDVFDTSTSADDMASQYTRVNYMLAAGSPAFLAVQAYWDRYSPLRPTTTGRLVMPNPPRSTVSLKVTSYLYQGKSATGDDIYEIQWTTTQRDPNDDTTPGTLYRGTLQFHRAQLNDTSDTAVIANPFGIQVTHFVWDTVR